MPSQTPELTPAERELLLGPWKGSTTDYPRHLTIHELFKQQAEARPAATALVLGSRRMTYRELDDRANGLANLLLAEGVKPEEPLGVLIERSFEMVIALLGILKAGGCYLPLDPDYPPARLRFMERDSGVRRVLTLDDVAGASKSSRHEATIPTCPERLAYLMYTSGSTGGPKGVAIPHRAVVRLVKDTDYCSFTAEDTFLALAPLAFDASTFEIWGPLLNGAELVITPPGPLGLNELGHTIVSCGVTTLWLTANLFHLMVDHQLESLKQVRQLLAGGDVLSPPHVRKLLTHCPRTVLINGYGPTENTTFTCCHVMRSPVDAGEGKIPIGKPIANTSVYVLDENRELVPLGLRGELYTGGDGLARGYWNQPELTKERFVPNPFDPGARLYRTGDWVSRRSDGALEFHGRLDNQVKIRGFRVELEEVEAALRTCPGVEEGAVVGHTRESGEKELVAYWMGTDTNGRNLQNLLSAHLPGHMVPTRFVRLREMPMTPSGKIDHKALISCAAANEAPAEAAVAPRTDPERQLARIWCELLERESIGIHQNFFQLGGHSLLATQMVSRIERDLGLKLPIRLVFEAPTIALFSAALASKPCARATLHPPEVSTGQRHPLSSAQKRLWFLEQLGGTGGAYHILKAVKIRGALDVAALHAACEGVVDRHQILHSVYRQIEGVPYQEALQGWGLALPIEDLRSLPPDHRELAARRWMEHEETAPFNLEEDLLIRVRLLRLQDDEHILLVVIHHIAADGWAMQIFWNELGTLYHALTTGDPSRLADPEMQYADYTVWQNHWLDCAETESQIRYWTECLRSMPQLELRTDRQTPPGRGYQGSVYRYWLPSELTHSLRKQSRSCGATFFMTLLAAFEVFLYRMSGQVDFGIGVPIANRNRREAEDLVGFFVNMLVLRADLSGNPTFLEVVDRVRNRTLEAFANQEAPFDVVVRALAPERSLDHNPLFTVILVLQTSDRVQLPELEADMLEVPFQRTRFDLEFHFTEVHDRLRGEIFFRADLFDCDTVQRMAEDFMFLLHRLMSAPEAPVGVPLVSETPHPRNPARESVIPLPPRTPLEDLIADIWKDALAVDRVNATDSFFQLGGHSLKAAVVMIRMSAILGFDVPVRRLFEFPTLAALAEAVEQDEPAAGQACAAARLYLQIRDMSDAEVNSRLQELG
jgi:amino acid adenylation domain-containing protein